MYLESPTFPVTVSASAGLSPDRLLAPNPLNAIWGKGSQALFPLLRGEADVVSIGYVTLLVAIIGLVSRWPQRRTYAVLLVCDDLAGDGAHFVLERAAGNCGHCHLPLLAYSARWFNLSSGLT